MLVLGRLDGAMRYCSPRTLSIFAGQVLKTTLIDALRQEGHAFTDVRFAAWFAGLTTLSDERTQAGLPPRVVCEAVLRELAHNAWDPLATFAATVSTALLAPRDLSFEGTYDEVHMLVTEARALIDALPHAAPPLPSLAQLHDAIAASTRFAPPERTAALVTIAGTRLTVDRTAPPSPRWAVEMLYGACLTAAQTLHYPLPLVGLVQLGTMNAEDAIEADTVRITALYHVATRLVDQLEAAAASSNRIELAARNWRSTSSAPDVFALLSGFGPMRSTQIERALGKTRLGVNGMLQALKDARLIRRTTIAGSHMFSVTDADHDEISPTAPVTVFSDAALDEYKASLAEIDRLLNRPPPSPD